MSLLALIGLTVLAGLAGAGIAGVTITVFLHRGITHGSHRMKPVVYAAGRWLTFFTVYMRHWEWRRIHRKHHLYTDVWIDEIRHDPHSPIVITQRQGIDGYRRVSWHMAAIFHAEAKLPDIRDDTYDNPKLDRPFDALDRRVFDHPVRGAVVAGIVYAVLFALAAPPVLSVTRTPLWELACVVAGVAALAVHIWVLLRFGGAINSDCHRGKVWVEGAGFAKNVKLLSFLIFGEGEHLTHHLYPQFARISARWDLGWRVIAVLRFLGLTEVVVDRETVLATRRLVKEATSARS
ncbi:MAG TPA: fatty acid desaturase [Acidimicrobiales bacterium]|nr:fatty acid desaturase [Acidimicrobiales bacterium]